MNMNSRSHSHSRGFSLIEVLIAVVILAFGLLALAALQVSLVRASSETKAQSVAVSLAKDTVEEMRSFQSMAGYQALTTRLPTAAQTFSAGGTEYRRWWTVTRYAYSPSTGAFEAITNTGATPTGYDTNNEFKRVVVRVSWVDPTGATRVMSMEDAVAALDPADSTKLAKLNKGTTPRKPKALIWNPSTTEGVIPIAIGGGSDTAATNPTPEVSGRNTNSAHVVETRYDILTYAALSNNRALAQARVETVIAGCQCDMVPATTPGFRPTYWNGERYAVPTAASFNAPGRAATNLAVEQSTRCTICCRDHHDPENVAGPTFSPRRMPPLGSSHAHYAPDAVSVVTTGLETLLSIPANVSPIVSTSPSTRYAEACRIIRVDGIFRVAADPYGDHMDLLRTNNDSAGNIQGLPTLPPATATATIPTTYNYAGPNGFVLSYMNNRFVNPSSGTAGTFYNTPSNGGEPVAGTLHPTQIVMRKDDVISRWHHLRGLYVDYLEPVAVARINSAKVACAEANARLAGSCDLRTKILSIIPFTSINLTEVAEWRAFRETELSNGSFSTPYLEDENYEHLFTTNNDFVTSFTADNVNASPVRGAVETGAKLPGTKAGAGIVVQPSINAEMYYSNSGLALLDSPINADETIKKDSQLFRLADGTPDANSGFFKVVIPVTTAGYTFSSSTSAYPKFSTATVTSRCSYATKNSGGNKKPNPFTCISKGLNTGTTTLSVSRYNYQTTGNVSIASCADANGQGEPRPYTGSGAVCRNFQVSSLTVLPTTNPARVITVAAPSNDGQIGETTAITLNNILPGDVMTLNLQPQATPSFSATCTYEMSNGVPVFTTTCP